MSTFESSLPVDRSSHSAENSNPRVLVNMANPSELRNSFATSSPRAAESADSSGTLTFDNPFNSSQATNQAGSMDSSTDSSALAASGAPTAQTELGLLATIDKDLVQLETELTKSIDELFHDLQKDLTGLENSLSALNGAPPCSDTSPANDSDGGDDEGDSTPSSQSSQSDAGDDDGGDDDSESEPSTEPSPAQSSEPTHDSPSHSSPTKSTEGSTPDHGGHKNASSPAKGASHPTSPTKGGETSTPTFPTTGSESSRPTSSDPFIANLQFSNPLMAKTLTDASAVMSPSGYSKLESNLEKTYTGSQNDFNGTKNAESGNPNYNVNLLSTALTRDGLSTDDQNKLRGVLEKDIPAALAPDKFLASLQQSDPKLANLLSDASKSMTKNGYSSLESDLQIRYSGNPNGAEGLPDQAYLDNVLVHGALSGSGLSDSDKSSLSTALKSDMPGALSTDQLQATLAQVDPSLHNVMSDASNQLSKQGFTQLENYVAENSTWNNNNNDGSLLHQSLTQAGLTSSDATALRNVLQSDSPAALTDVPSGATLGQMAWAKESYMNDFSLDGTNVGDVAGNPGKSGTGWTESDQVPSGVQSELPWSAVAPLNENSYDKNAQVQIDDTAVYLHKKTGGWVEAISPDNVQYWDATYANNNNAIGQADGHVKSDGSYQFSAPPTADNIQFGTGHVAFDPSLYDGVFETMAAKTDVANSGLGMDLSGDYFLKNLAPGQIRPGAGESNWVPLTNQYQTLDFTTLSQAELQADAPPDL